MRGRVPTLSLLNKVSKLGQTWLSAFIQRHIEPDNQPWFPDASSHPGARLVSVPEASDNLDLDYDEEGDQRWGIHCRRYFGAKSTRLVSTTANGIPSVYLHLLVVMSPVASQPCVMKTSFSTHYPRPPLSSIKLGLVSIHSGNQGHVIHWDFERMHKS